MDQSRRGTGRTSAALRHAMHLAQEGPVAFVAQTVEAANQLVNSAKAVGNASVHRNLSAHGATGYGVDVERGTVAGYSRVVFDHYVVEALVLTKTTALKTLQTSIDNLLKRPFL